MSDLSSTERLNLLEDRITRIEEHLGIEPMAAEPAPASPPVARLIPVAPQIPQLEELARIELQTRERAAYVPPSPLPIPTLVPPPPVTSMEEPRIPPPPPAPLPSARELEHTIGLKWSGWIGAVVLVVGAVLGVQYAYDNHWFGRLPPVLRLSFIVAAGMGLIGAGEIVFRRVNRISAASLFGAGVATLFVAAYAGFAYFDLYSRPTSLTLMGLSALVGAAAAMRGNLVSIAILSLIGANIAPLLVTTENPAVVPFLFYLLAMQIVALFLAQWGRGGKWWILRGCALLPQMFWMTGLLTDNPSHHPAILAMMCVFALLYHGDLILAAIRNEPDSPSLAERFIGSSMAIAVTAAFTGGVLTYFADASNDLRAAWVLGAAAISAGFGFGLPQVHSNLKRLAIAHRIAATALLVLWVPILTTGVRVEIGWMLLAIAFATSWRLTASPISRIAAPVVWSLGLAHLFFSAMELGNSAIWLTVWGTAITNNVILAWMFALAGHAIAALIAEKQNAESSDERWDATVRLLSVLCSLVWFTSSIAGLPPLGATGWILAYAWLLLLAERAGLAPSPGEMAVTALLIATIKWAAVDTLQSRLSPEWTATRPVFNSLMGVGVLLAGSLLAFVRLLPRPLHKALGRVKRHDDSDFGVFTAAAIIALMTIGLSFEVDRVVSRAVDVGWQYAYLPASVRQLSWTILWSLSASALIACTMRIAAPDRRGKWIGFLWPLGALLAAKFVLIDTLSPFLNGDPVGTPILNLDVLAGAAVLGCLSTARLHSPKADNSDDSIPWKLGTVAAFLIAWMGTLEIARFVARLHLDSPALAWHLKNLGWTIWWCLVAAASMIIAWRADRRTSQADHQKPWLMVWPNALSAIAMKFIIIDAIAWRLGHLPVSGWRVLFNFDVLTAAVVLAGLILSCLLAAPSAVADRIKKKTMAFAVTILLISGTLEVDRAFSSPALRQLLNNPDLAEQVALSIFWAIFAVTSLMVGFWRRLASLRYFALALLALTLLKVVIVDMSQFEYGYRVLSFLGLGLLLLGTSVMYGKISPKLLGR